MASRGLILDFDGVIIDSETPLFRIWSEIYAEHGHVLTLDEWQHALGTQGGFDPLADLATRLARAISKDELSGRVREQHWARCGDEPLRPGVRERLLDAREAGWSTAVASSSPAAWVRPWLDRHELSRLIDAVCTRDDVERVKPAPDLFLLAARRMGVPPNRCLVVEDSPNGIRAALAAGMDVIVVPNELTRSLDLPGPHTFFESLADVRLEPVGDRP
jgi:HAD superfamily hydrolase (TIGR01509 family)